MASGHSSIGKWRGGYTRFQSMSQSLCQEFIRNVRRSLAWMFALCTLGPKWPLARCEAPPPIVRDLQSGEIASVVGPPASLKSILVDYRAPSLPLSREFCCCCAQWDVSKARTDPCSSCLMRSPSPAGRSPDLDLALELRFPRGRPPR